MMGLVLRHIHFQTKKTSSPDKTQYRDPRQTRRRLNPYSLAIVVAVARPYTPRRESNFCPQSLGLAPTAQIHGRGPTHRLAGATARGFVRNPSSEAWLVVREARRAIHPRISAEHSGCKNGEPKLGHHRLLRPFARWGAATYNSKFRQTTTNPLSGLSLGHG